jgi:uncharacterized protein
MTMPAGETTAGQSLLALQTVDTQLDQLRHRREHLPQRAELAAGQAALAALATRRDELSERRAALVAETERLELEVLDVEDRSAYANRVLYGGTVKALKELTALQDEIARFATRKSDLEDRALATMEEVDGLDADLAGCDAERDRLDAQSTALIAAITEAEVAIDAEIDQLRAERSSLAAPLDASLLARYESLRSSLGGVGVARIEGNRCLGCHLTLPAMDIDRIRHLPAGEIARCPECDRLLVRPPAA